MSDPYYVYFENVEARTDADFFSKIAKWLISKDFKFSSFWVGGDEVDANLEEAVKKLPKGGSIWFVHNENDIHLDYLGRVSLHCHPTNFKDSAFTDLFIDTVKKLYFELMAERVYGVFPSYLTASYQKVVKRKDYVSWISIFSPETVKKIGKEKLMHIQTKKPESFKGEFKAYRTESLQDGSFLLVLTQNPRDSSIQFQENVSEVLFGKPAQQKEKKPKQEIEERTETIEILNDILHLSKEGLSNKKILEELTKKWGPEMLNEVFSKTKKSEKEKENE